MRDLRFPPRRPAGRPVVWAHRGARQELPENTIAAFERALDVGADAIETDARLTRDGAVVLFHDADGARVARRAARVADTTLDELASWDVGHALGQAGRGHRAPTLDDALVTLPEVSFNVDVKDGTAAAVDAVIEVVRARGAEERVLLTGFDARTPALARARGYAGPIGAGVADVLSLLGRRASSLGPRALPCDAVQVPTHLGPLPTPVAALVARCRRAGVRLDVFTVDEPDRALALAALGVDGVMSDDPRAVAAAFA